VAACLAKRSLKKTRTAWPKMIGSETFIIVALRWSEKSTPSALALAICSFEEGDERLLAHDRGVDDLAGLERSLFLEDLFCAVGGDELDAHGGRGGDGDGLLVGEEIVVAHRGDGGLRVGDQAPMECGCLRA
jgi:hypothetical protein